MKPQSSPVNNKKLSSLPEDKLKSWIRRAPMSFRREFPATCPGSMLCVASSLLLQLLLLLPSVSSLGSSAAPKWQTLSGDAPFVIARGGFSGLFPDSSAYAYDFALQTSVPDVILWCDVQLTKDAAGICFPDVKLDNGSNIAGVYSTTNKKVYDVNGVRTQGWFAVDYTLNGLANVFLTQGVQSRTNRFDGNPYQIQTVEDVFSQFKPQGFWLNVQHDAFYSQHNLSMRSYVLSVSRRVIVNYISSPEVSFLRSIATRFRRSTTKLVFRFLGQAEIEPSTNQTYGSLLKNISFVKTFASGIIVPKSYIWPVDDSLYLLPHTSVVSDAHKEGLEIFASDFANDASFSYNYSYDPVSEYVNFIDNGDFSVDGVITDFPITTSEAIDCFAHLGKNASKQADLLVISKNGASGDYPGCTDLAYAKAVDDGADVIDCPVHMTKDGVPICLGSINLMDSTTVAQSSFSNLTKVVPEITPGNGIFTFDLTWSDIQSPSLRPAIANPQAEDYKLFRNPKLKNAGNFVSLADILDLAKNSTSLSGVLIGIENAAYLAEKQGLGVIDAVVNALGKAGFDKQSTQKVLIQSSDSSVLKAFKGNNYELVYKVNETIHDALNGTVEDIKSFADSVVVTKSSIFPVNQAFITEQTDVVTKIQSFKLPVYVELFSNEFTSQAWDFFSDPTVEINSFYSGAGINGVITDFPKTSARYTRNRCLKRGKNTPQYMYPVQPGGLMQVIFSGLMPPTQAPLPVLNPEDVVEGPLPAVMKRKSTSTSDSASAPSSPSSQPKLAAASFVSMVIMLFTFLLLV